MRTKNQAGAVRGALACVVAAAVTGLAAEARAQGDFIGFGVTQFGGASQGECDASPLLFTTWESDNLYDVFKKWTDDGCWDAASKKKNQEVDGVDFLDATKYGGGYDDHAGIGCDSGDVCFLSTHGGADWGSTSTSEVYWVMGDSSYECRPSSKDMLYGNTASGRTGDTEILIVDACKSGQLGVWNGTNVSLQSGFFEFVNSTSTLSTYLAYHGLAPDRYAFIDEYAEDVYSDGVGIDWLLEAFVSGNMADDQDTCPVAVVFGSSSANRDLMFEWGGMADRKNTGTRTAGASYYFLEGCDPEGGNPVSTSGADCGFGDDVCGSDAN
jgi:hypothetical protein